MSDRIDLGITHMNLQPALHYSRKNLPKIKPFQFKSIKSNKKVKSDRLQKNRSTCLYNKSTNRCKYGSPHDDEKCILNTNGHCERHKQKHDTKTDKTTVSIRLHRCKNGTRRNQYGNCVAK